MATATVATVWQKGFIYRCHYVYCRLTPACPVLVTCHCWWLQWCSNDIRTHGVLDQCAASACAACDFLASLIQYCCLMGLVHGEKYSESASSCPCQPGASYIITWSLSHILMTAMCVQLLRGLMKVMCVQLLRGLYVNYLAHACPTITYIPLVITKGAREG